MFSPKSLLTSLSTKLGISARALVCGLICSSALLLNGCSAPEPTVTVAPELTIDKLMLATDSSQPKFVVLYTLEHSASTPVPLYRVDADLFINEQKVASYTKNYSQELIAPNHPVQYRLEIPTNPAGKASVDSLRNNPLLMMQGSCNLKVTVTNNEANQDLNPSVSYHGIINIDNQEQIDFAE